MENSFLKMSTAYLPPLDFFAALVKNGRFMIDTRELYRKQSFRNRAFIVTSQGPLALSLPCVKPYGKNTQVRKVSVLMTQHWAREHWRSLCTAYNKSPYFLYYRDELESYYMGLESGKEREMDPGLLEINDFFIDFVIRRLKLDVQRVYPSPAKGLDVSGEISIPDGKMVPVSMDFSPKDTCKFEYEPYMQTFISSMPLGHLSILDLLFNVGPEAAYYLGSARMSC